MPAFNWELSLGTLIATISIIVTVLASAYKARLRFDMLERKVNVLFAAFLNDLAAKGVDGQALKRFFEGDT